MMLDPTLYLKRKIPSIPETSYLAKQLILDYFPQYSP